MSWGSGEHEGDLRLALVLVCLHDFRRGDLERGLAIYREHDKVVR